MADEPAAAADYLRRSGRPTGARVGGQDPAGGRPHAEPRPAGARGHHRPPACEVDRLSAGQPPCPASVVRLPGGAVPQSGPAAGAGARFGDRAGGGGAGGALRRGGGGGPPAAAGAALHQGPGGGVPGAGRGDRGVRSGWAAFPLRLLREGRREPLHRGGRLVRGDGHGPARSRLARAASPGAGGGGLGIPPPSGRRSP